MKLDERLARALHARCEAEWRARDAMHPGLDQTLHGWDAHHAAAIAALGADPVLAQGAADGIALAGLRAALPSGAWVNAQSIGPRWHVTLWDLDGTVRVPDHDFIADTIGDAADEAREALPAPAPDAAGVPGGAP